MKRLFNKLCNYTGATLLEVLMALAITGIITMAIMKLYVTQHENYMTQEDITTIQQNARSSIDELSRGIRMAGRQLPPGLDAITAYDTNPDTIVITFRSNECETFISAPMPQPSSELKCGTPVDCFSDGQWVYIYEPDSGVGEWFEITHTQESPSMIQHNTMNLSRKYGTNSLVLSIDQVKFFVDNTTDPDHPNLMVQPFGGKPQVYAEDITDLQFRYRLVNGNLVDVPVISHDIREVMIAVTSRSRNQNVENPSDPYRFRTFSSSVNLRNVGT